MSDTLTERLRISTSLLSGMPALLAAKGLDFGSLAGAAGLDPAYAVREDEFVGLGDFAKLMEIAAIVAGDDCFGLHCADALSPRMTGTLSYAMQNAPTVRDALVTLIRYIRTRIDVANLELTVEGNRASVEWSFSPLIMQRTHLSDYTAVLLVRYISRLTRAPWKPTAVSIERVAPSSLEAHRRIFGRRPDFSEQGNAIEFPATLLNQPIEGADPTIYKMAQQLLDRLLAERGESSDLVTSAREEIIWSLPSDDGVQLDRLARRLGLSSRSLQRRLAEVGTSFHELVDDTRKMLARRYLEEQRLSFSEISYRLGFSAPSAFTRACRRWFGDRPGEIRRRLRAEPPLPER